MTSTIRRPGAAGTDLPPVRKPQAPVTADTKPGYGRGGWHDYTPTEPRPHRWTGLGTASPSCRGCGVVWPAPRPACPGSYANA
jgi:hypothetical protein